MADRGVSLLELLIILVILSIAAALVIPDFSSLLELYNVKKAARQLVTDLQFAKMRAVAEGVDYRVSFVSGDNPSYTVEKNVGAGAWSVIDIIRDLGDPGNPYYAKHVSVSTQSEPLRVIFSPLGSASPAASIIFHSPTHRFKTVRVILTGRIRLE